ncbi:MAG TPA: family 10 glycosylhydrolase [Terriglobales bacterium]|nr:family 10 glycosylhydrolase [Terriglobales bacterium]
MDRRSFLKTAGITAAALAGSGLNTGLFAGSTKPGDAAKVAGKAKLKNWVWMATPRSEPSADELKRAFAQMRAAGISAIVPEVYNGRKALYPSKHLPVDYDLLGKLLPLAKAEGLEVHAWMLAMPCMLKEIMTQHPDWYNVNAKGESAVDKPAYVDYYRFLDPGRPEVRQWVQGTVQELASVPELDGVHLDYIRHPDAILPKGLWKKYNIVQDRVYPQYDYGYTEYERNEFKKKYGEDPIKLKDPTSNKQWFQFQLDMVTGLVNDYLVPAAHGKGKKLTAAVFPGPSMAREMVRQDWGKWNLDGFLPMLYNGFYEAGPEWVTEQTKEGVSTAKGPVYSGLFVHDVDAAMVNKLVEAALAGGAPGVTLFSSRGMDEAKWKAFGELMKSKGVVA